MNVKVLLCGCALVMATTAYVCAGDGEEDGGSVMERAHTEMPFSPQPGNGDGTDPFGAATAAWDGVVDPTIATLTKQPDILKDLADNCAQAKQDVELSQARLNSTLHSTVNNMAEILAAHSANGTTSLTQEERAELQNSHQSLLSFIDQARGSTQELLNALGRWKDLLVKVVDAHPASEGEGMSTPLAPIPPATMPDRPTKKPEPTSSDSE